MNFLKTRNDEKKEIDFLEISNFSKKLKKDNERKKFKATNETKFDLIIDLQSKIRNTFILKRIPHSNFYSTTFGNLFSSKKVKYNSKNHVENLSIFLNEKIKIINFNPNKLPKNLINEAKKLLPKSNYIGYSITQGNEYRKKSWSIYKFISLANN